MTITPEALEALSQKADEKPLEHGMSFLAALEVAYRTGQLILAQPSGDEVEGRVIADVVKWLRTGGHLQQRCSIQSACVLSNAATALETGEWRNAQSV